MSRLRSLGFSLAAATKAGVFLLPPGIATTGLHDAAGACRTASGRHSGGLLSDEARGRFLSQSRTSSSHQPMERRPRRSGGGKSPRSTIRLNVDCERPVSFVASGGRRMATTTPYSELRRL